MQSGFLLVITHEIEIVSNSRGLAIGEVVFGCCMEVFSGSTDEHLLTILSQPMIAVWTALEYKERPLGREV